MSETYRPNLANPRVTKRVRHALGFALGVLDDQPHEWSTRFIDLYFGQQQNPLSRWLRQLLIIIDDHHYNPGLHRSKQVRLNRPGAVYLRELLAGRVALNFDQWRQYAPMTIDYEDSDCEAIEHYTRYDQEVVYAWARREYGQELDSRQFIYTEKSWRLWHPLQHMRRRERQELLASYDLTHQYDICAAAPTMILYHAHHCGMSEWLESLRDYINDRNQLRQYISQLADIPERDAKVLINALFCGARLGANEQFQIFHLLGRDPARIQVLREDPRLTALRQDIKTCWSYISETMPRTKRHYPDGRSRMLPISPRDRWMRYFELERSVLNVVRDHLDRTGNAYFLEHDGWTCEKAVDVDALVCVIKEKTGITIQFEHKEKSSATTCAE